MLGPKRKTIKGTDVADHRTSAVAADFTEALDSKHWVIGSSKTMYIMCTFKHLAG